MNGKITFLGTGTSSGIPMLGCTCEVCTSSDPKDRRLRTSALVEYSGARIIIDAGPDFREQMLRTGVTSADAILLTHAHMDHIGGLDEVRSFNYFLKKGFPIYCEKKVEEALRKVFYYAFDEPRYPGAPDFEMHNITESEKFYIGDAGIMPIRIMHGRLPILGYRFGTLGYITDASYISEDSIRAFKGCSVLVISAVTFKPHPSHFRLEEALEAAAQIGPQRCYLTHLSHRLGTYASLTHSLPEWVQPAYDGLEVGF